MSSTRSIQTPDPGRQLRFHGALLVARKAWLIDALNEALAVADPAEIKRQITHYVPTDVQRVLAAAGIRDEHVFPTPLLLEVQPSLVGYYRLLLGVPQKTFYRAGTGMGMFRNMEISGKISPRQRALLPEFCTAMASALTELVRQLSPAITPRDVAELPLLTLGSQLQGGNNNTIGQTAIKGIFLAIAKIAQGMIIRQTATELRVETPRGRSFLIALANDPDVRLQEVTPVGLCNRLSIEVKGGTDTSNVYNRGGEAEKSHQAARAAGYTECWTIINMKNIDVSKLKGGSPTTDEWFDTSQILAQQGPEWDQFLAHIHRHLGL